MRSQITFLPIKEADDEYKKQKRKWENAFQKWSDKEAQDGTTSDGKCGYGEVCRYCENNDYGRPCVRALNQMLRETRKKIDYNAAEFEDVWYGNF